MAFGIEYKLFLYDPDMAILNNYAMKLSKFTEVVQQYSLHSGYAINWKKFNFLPLRYTISILQDISIFKHTVLSDGTPSLSLCNHF